MMVALLPSIVLYSTVGGCLRAPSLQAEGGVEYIVLRLLELYHIMRATPSGNPMETFQTQPMCASAVVIVAIARGDDGRDRDRDRLTLSTSAFRRRMATITKPTRSSRQ